MASIFALVDCNNFYASCERVFNPALVGRPVVVLSNNDGCIIARSEEAKKLGLKMGEPYFKAKEMLTAHGVHVFSSNYPLYGNMSNRVMRTLGEFTPEVEVYSIDEAFLDLSHLQRQDRTAYGRTIRTTVRQWTGIPVSVGIAPTKTLAKIANAFAKRAPKADGVLDLTGSRHIERALLLTPIERVWGVGRRWAKLLKANGMHTALDFRDYPSQWVQRSMGVVGLRMQQELRGIPAISLESAPSARRGVSYTRSFSTGIDDLTELREAIGYFTSRAAEKLRRHGLAARAMIVFIGTNRFQDDTSYNSSFVELPAPTDDTPELLDHASRALERIHRKGRVYKRGGVMFADLIPAGDVQTAIFDNRDRDRQRRLMSLLDGTNARLGGDTLRYAVAGTNGDARWRGRSTMRSPRYTTSWNDLAQARAV